MMEQDALDELAEAAKTAAPPPLHVPWMRVSCTDRVMLAVGDYVLLFFGLQANFSIKVSAKAELKFAGIHQLKADGNEIRELKKPNNLPPLNCPAIQYVEHSRIFSNLRLCSNT